MVNQPYDVLIIGGGLAGLSSSILLGRAGYKVALFEKKRYPYHKVCGEYISLESRNFLGELGLDIEGEMLPQISRFRISHSNGAEAEMKLPLGGFGCSRFKLDDFLADKALEAGVVLLQETEVTDCVFREEKDLFELRTKESIFEGKLVIGSYGKRERLDKKFKRPFSLKSRKGRENFVGIKYHVKGSFPEDLIELHLFKDGYCGVSRVEGEKCCLCYLTTSEQLQRHKGDIVAMEREICEENPRLKPYFEEYECLYEEPLAISQIVFSDKEQVLNHMIMAGDAAGLITPLSGNGMSMALHGGKLAAESCISFLREDRSRVEMENHYRRQWRKLFQHRMSTGRLFQRIFYRPSAVGFLIKLCAYLPFVGKILIRKTHGKPY